MSAERNAIMYEQEFVFFLLGINNTCSYLPGIPISINRHDTVGDFLKSLVSILVTPPTIYK